MLDDVKGMNSSSYAKSLNITHDEYVALVDIIEPFITVENDTTKETYEEAKNNVMRRFDLDEKEADRYINVACYGLMLHSLGEMTVNTTPKLLKAYTPDIAIINTTKSTGALSLIKSNADVANDSTKEEYSAELSRLAEEAGLGGNIINIALQQVPQLVNLLVLYPPFALGLIDEDFVIAKLVEEAEKTNASPIVTKANMHLIFSIATINERAVKNSSNESEDEEN